VVENKNHIYGKEQQLVLWTDKGELVLLAFSLSCSGAKFIPLGESNMQTVIIGYTR
jgi:hypothetical protein